MCSADAYVAVLSITVFKSINRCPLKFSGHYRGINELEKVGFSGRLQLNSISPDMIERVEVVSGASSIYGAGATGGIINIITKRGSGDGVNFETKLGVTSGDNFKSDALAYEAFQSASFNQGDWSGFIGASYTQRGEIQDSRGDRVGPEVAQTDRQDTETVDVNGRLSWQLADKQ